ncbi:DoxX family protein [Flavobacterium sp. ANB]|uniref:DoxX family protein n=1 Tax=unclassified Flavobacterium TaxID=196869 RepID=UPI0012B6CF78|nr:MULTISPECIES: DoxX family protein [unclassified Flavobacterium]MBF4515469.1 DoxX family protein [Flavobacterium sp. ANB]MTD68472.1 DoxX family protein [Flavobacterium sp. LC2016-13]
MAFTINQKAVKIFLRLALSIGFLSAVADRFGLWSKEVSAWGNWENFVAYTKVLNPLIPESLINPVAIIATAAEVIFAIFLLIGFKTELFARLSGFLLLLFALSMTFTIGIKGPLDYSVFTSAAAAFALSLMKEKYMEIG